VVHDLLLRLVQARRSTGSWAGRCAGRQCAWCAGRRARSWACWRARWRACRFGRRWARRGACSGRGQGPADEAVRGGFRLVHYCHSSRRH